MLGSEACEFQQTYILDNKCLSKPGCAEVHKKVINQAKIVCWPYLKILDDFLLKTTGIGSAEIYKAVELNYPVCKTDCTTSCG